MSTISYPLPLPPNNFSTQIASTSVATNALTVQLDIVAGLPTEGVGQFFKKDANGDVVSGSIEFVHWTGVAGSSITFSDVGDRGITGSDSGAQSYVADDYFECWVSSYYATDPDRTPGLTNIQTWTGANTFNSLKVDDAGIDIEQIATPANPSSGRNKAYFKSDDKLYKLTSAGVESEVGGSTVAEDGWTASGETWTYASADDPTFTFTIAGVDLTTKYSAGMRIKLTQTTVKYFIITKVAFSTDTTITVYGGTDYDLANAAITLPYYSTQKAPALFPLDPTKWSVLVTDTTDRTAGGTTASVWYNISQGDITLPIGVWNVFRSAFPGVTGTSTSYVLAYVTLSTANNTESDKKHTDILEINSGTSTMRGANVFTKEMLIAVTSKTAYYTNIMGEASTVSAIGMQNSRSTLVLRATCAYL